MHWGFFVQQNNSQLYKNEGVLYVLSGVGGRVSLAHMGAQQEGWEQNGPLVCNRNHSFVLVGGGPRCYMSALPA